MELQYVDYAEWERERMRGEEVEREKKYWKEQLRGITVLELPYDRPRPPVKTYKGAREKFEIHRDLADSLKALSRRANATLYMLLIASFQALLCRFSGQSDIVIGSPIAGRRKKEIENLIGLFVNTLAIRLKSDPQASFNTFLKHVRSVTLDAYTYQGMPFDKLVEELEPHRELSRSAIFDVMFTLQNAPDHTLELDGLALNGLEYKTRTAKFDLNLTMAESAQGLTAWLDYSTDLFDATTIKRLCGHLNNLLNSVVSDADIRLSDLSLMSVEEQHQIRNEFNDTRRDFSEPILIHNLIELQSQSTPDAVAVIFEDRSLTFSALNEQANHLARRLRSAGIFAEDIVGIYADRSIEMVVGLLGVLKAGAAYLPLDPSYPDERIAFMVEDSRAKVLLTQQHLLDALPHQAVSVMLLDGGGQGSTLSCGESLPVEVHSDNPAYIIYTSGSTGKPKGVMISHSGICNRLLWMQDEYGMDEADAVLQKTSFGFDVSVWEFFWPLAVGARLVMARPGGHKDPYYLVDEITRQGITTLHFVPAMLQVFLDEPTSRLCESLKRVICSGEALSYELQEKFYSRLDADLHNLYGPTEASVDVTYWKCEKETTRRAVPIGRPIANTQIYILDARTQAVAVGVAGELYIGGVGLGRGYINRPDLTAERFIPNPFDRAFGSRLYATGDLTRFLADGSIEYIGRLDHQVKIRGFRIELGEIEAAFRSNQKIVECAVAVKATGTGEKRLVAYYVSHQQIDEARLKSELALKLPDYMIPSLMARLDQLPLTPNGKVDKRALPELESLTSYLTDEAVRPRSPEEELLTGIWSNVLGVESIGVYESFFDLGGHSLSATKVISRVNETFKVELSLRHLFESPTIAALAERVKHSNNLRVPPLEVAPRNKPLPLSFAQQRLWLLEQLDPGSAAYCLPVLIRFKGNLNIPVMEGALREIVRRHESLRTTFPVGNAEPTQVITPPGLLVLTIRDLSLLPVEQREIALNNLAAEETARPFDLELGPMMRMGLVILGRHDHAMMLTFHHIISDGWSVSVMLDELAAIYKSYGDGSQDACDLPVQYADYAVWQRQWLQGEAIQTQLDYWKQKLKGIEVLDLPTDYPRPRFQTFNGAMIGLKLSESLTASLKRMCRNEGVTMFMALLAAFKVLLGRLSGQSDIVVGVPIAGRTQSSIERLIGFFNNTLVMRSHLPTEINFREALAHIREVALDAYAYQDLPFERLVEELQPERDLSRQPLFQVFFNMLNFDSKPFEIDGLSAEFLSSAEYRSKFDLTLYAKEQGDAIVLKALYNADLFSQARMAEMLNSFERLLSQIVGDSLKCINEYSLISDSAKVLLPDLLQPLDGNSTGTIHARFSKIAESHPDRLAVCDGNRSLTFKELDLLSNRLANHLQENGIEHQDVVAIYARRSASLVCAVLGILKAGAQFSILDPAYPPLRLIECLRIAQPRGWVQIDTADPLPTVLSDYVSNSSICCRVELSNCGSNGAGQSWMDSSDDNPGLSIEGSGAAYVAFTSGTTGNPKAILGTHAPVSHFLEWHIRKFALNESDRFIMLSGLSHDPLLRDIFTPLSIGATLYIPDPEYYGSPARLVAWMRENRITVVHLTPAIGQLMMQGNSDSSVSIYCAPSIRYAFFGGDVLTGQEASNFKEFAPNAEVVNFYGTTETPQAMAYYKVDTEPAGCNGTEARPPKSTLPIGREIDDVQLLVLNTAQKLAGVGELGEIYIRTPYLCRGYLGDETLNKERFIRNPHTRNDDDRMYKTGDLGRYLPDGNVELLGRADQQVKIRGLRIELGEVEASLRSHPFVRDCALIIDNGRRGSETLIAYVVARDDKQIASSELWNYLKQRLPIYMIPSAFVNMAEIPLTANGKPDRQALLSVPRTESEAIKTDVGELTPVEEVLLAIWSEVLGRDSVCVNDNFFEIGGHSLLATQVISRIRKRFKADLPLRYIFESPTVAGLAQSLEKIVRSQGGLEMPALARVSRDKALPLSFSQERQWLLDQLDPGSPAYNIFNGLRLSGDVNVAALEQSFRIIGQRHEILRTSFHAINGRPIQSIDADVKFRMPLVDLEGLSVPEADRLGQRLAAEASGRGFDLSSAPIWQVISVKLAEAEHALFLTMHHIVFDGWSTSIFTRELISLYEDLSTGKPSRLASPPVQYADFACWQREWIQGEVLDRQVNYWKSNLDHTPFLALPTDWPRPTAQTFRGAQQTLSLSPDLTGALKALGRREGATLFATLLAAFKALLSRLSGQEDVSVGTFVANRRHADLEGLIGFFVNNLALRTDLSGDPTFRELVHRVREVTLEAYNHQDIPFEKLIEQIRPERLANRTPLFQVMFVLQNTPRSALRLPGLALSRYARAAQERANFDLTLFLSEDSDRLAGHLQYCADLFSEATISRVTDRFITLLEAVAANPDQPLSAIPVLCEIERSRSNAVAGGQTGKLPAEKAAVAKQPMTTDKTNALAAKRSKLTHRLEGLSAERRALLEKRLRGEAIRPPQRQALVRRVVEAPAPLSFSQHRLWFLDQLEPNSPAYNVSGTLGLTGQLNLPALVQAVNEITRRHECLRTKFISPGGKPVQIITLPTLCDLPVIDLENFKGEERDLLARRLVREVARQPINLAAGPLLQTRLMRLNGAEHFVIFLTHHIIFDAWSTGIFVQELGALYESFYSGEASSLEELPIQYADFAVWQRNWLEGETLEAQLSYWKRQFPENPPMLKLPTDRPRPAYQSYRGARAALYIPKSLTQSLKTLCQDEGVTTFMLLLGAFQILLSRYSGQDDITVGIPIAGRYRPEIEKLIGFFINTLALRIKIQGNPSFREILKDVREVTLGAYGHQDLPFEKLVEELQLDRDISQTPLFQVMFMLQNVPKQTLDLPGLKLSGIGADVGTSKFDLSLSMSEARDELYGTMVYNTDLFEAGTISKMLEHYKTLLERIVADPNERIKNISLSQADERRRWIEDFNDEIE
ncbi:MAG: amino acid adenylation domain-containing protein [Blastocatellia bacterium]